jgi:hypothetical protein
MNPDIDDSAISTIRRAKQPMMRKQTMMSVSAIQTIFGTCMAFPPWKYLKTDGISIPKMGIHVRVEL